MRGRTRQAGGMMFGVTQGTALVFLFVILPVLLAVVVAWFVERRSAPFPAEHRTSHLLREGTPAEATLIDWRLPPQPFLDRHPMVTFDVEVAGDPPAAMQITQSVRRPVLRSLEKGMTVDIRLSPDRAAAAIVFGSPMPESE